MINGRFRIQSFLSDAVLPGVVIGALCGLLEALVLHYASAAEYRDRYLFLIAVGTYALAGALFALSIHLLFALARLKSALLSARSISAAVFGAFCILEVGSSGAKSVAGDAWPTWALMLLAIFLICWLVGAKVLKAVRREVGPLKALFSLKGRVAAFASILCVAGVATALVASTAPEAKGKPNVLLIVMDTMRADALSCYGNARRPKTTPALDMLASEGTLFERAFAQGTWTSPTHASIFTGLHPTQHGVSTEHLYLAKDYVTVAELMKHQGLNTIGICCNTGYINREMGLTQGFDRFHQVPSLTPEEAFYVETELREEYPRLRLLSLLPLEQERKTFADLFPAPDETDDWGAAKATTLAARWMARYRSEKPFFMFINYLESHHPYTPAKPYRDDYLPDGLEQTPSFSSPHTQTLWKDLTEGGPRGHDRLLAWMMSTVEPYYQFHRGAFDVGPQFKTAIRALYDAKARYLDDQINKLMTYMRQEGILDNTVLIVMSDHGESFGENRVLWHLPAMYNSLIHVPLIVRYPPRVPAGKRVDRIVQAIDVFPTLEDLFAIRLDAGADQRFGSSLFEGGEDDRLVISQIVGIPQPSLRASLRMMKTRLDRQKLEAKPKTPHDAFRTSLGNRWRRANPAIAEILDQLAAVDMTTEGGQDQLERIAKRIESNPPLRSCLWTARVAVLDGRWKYIWRAFEKDSLYDLRADPGEENDLIDIKPKLAKELYGKLAARLAQFEPADITQPIPDSDEQSKGPLPGYIR